MSNQQLSQICERLGSRYPAVVAEVVLANPAADTLDLDSLRHDYLNRLGSRILSRESPGPQTITVEQPPAKSPNKKIQLTERAQAFEDILWEYANSLHENYGEILNKDPYKIRDEVRALVGTDERAKHFQGTIDQIGDGQYELLKGKEEMLKIKLRAYCRLDEMKPACYPMRGGIGTFVLLEYIAAQPGAKSYGTLAKMWHSFNTKKEPGRGTSLETVLENGERYLEITKEYASILFDAGKDQARYVNAFLSQLPITKGGEENAKDPLDPKKVFGHNFERMRFKDALNQVLFDRVLTNNRELLERDHIVEVIKGKIRVIPGKQSDFNRFMLKRVQLKE